MTPTIDATRERLAAKTPPRHWWVCRCGRHLDRHSARTIPSTGGREYVCSLTKTGRYEPETLPELDYTPEKGVHKP